MVLNETGSQTENNKDSILKKLNSSDSMKINSFLTDRTTLMMNILKICREILLSTNETSLSKGIEW
jgi:hypothetical protein